MVTVGCQCLREKGSWRARGSFSTVERKTTSKCLATKPLCKVNDKLQESVNSCKRKGSNEFWNTIKTDEKSQMFLFCKLFLKKIAGPSPVMLRLLVQGPGVETSLPLLLLPLLSLQHGHRQGCFSFVAHKRVMQISLLLGHWLWLAPECLPSSPQDMMPFLEMCHLRVGESSFLAQQPGKAVEEHTMLKYLSKNSYLITIPWFLNSQK